jgi:DNA gyrase subunit B
LPPLTFKPDLGIFKSGIEFDFTTLALRLQEVAYLNPGLKTVLQDLRQSHLATGAQVEIYHYTKGIGEFISEANRDKRSLCQVISAQGEKDGVQIYTAWQWSAFADTDFLRRSFSGNILLKKLIEQEFRTNREYVFDTLHLLSFANQVRTIDGGTHVEGLKAGILKGLNSFAHKYQQLPDNSNLQWSQARNGLTAIVAVNLSQPEYGGPMKWKLANPEVTGLVKAMVTEALIAYLDTHPEEGKEIFKLCLAVDTRGKTDS